MGGIARTSAGLVHEDKWESTTADKMTLACGISYSAASFNSV